MSLLFTLIAFFVALEVLVVVHEGGHFVAARLCGVRVLRFSLGFGPVIFRRRGKSGTEYAFSLLPLGGYVKMLDARDPECEEDVTKSPSEDFEGKPLWQRAFIVFAGPFMNLVLAIAIFWGIGIAGTYELSSRVAEPAAGTPAAIAGVKGGEYVAEVGGLEVTSFADLQVKLMRASGERTTITVREKDDPKGERARRYPIDLTDIGFKEDPSKARPLQRVGLMPWQGAAAFVDVVPGSAAEKAGLKAGDRVLAIDGVPVPGVQDFVRIVSGGAGSRLLFKVKRGEAQIELPVTVPEETDPKTGKKVGRIGVHVGGEPDVILVRLGPLDALASGFGKLWDTTALSLQVMAKMVVGEASVKNLSGPVAIADYAGQAAKVGLLPYLYFLALMSISLGVLNLLPVPVLDGGHLALYAYEAVAGRPPSERFLAAAQKTGLGLILLVMLIALVNDVGRLLGG